MMRKSIGILLNLLFVYSVAPAQNLDSTIAKYANDFGQERTYLQYDKPAYAPGETVWFKAYLMKGVAPSGDSKTFYTDWTDDTGKLLLHTVSPLLDATTTGQFEFPAA